LNFSPQIFKKNTHSLNITKIGPVTAELFYVDGRTDRRRNRHGEAKSRFRNFANEPIKVQGLDEVREEPLFMKYTYLSWKIIN